jgi:hypothetical protein
MSRLCSVVPVPAACDTDVLYWPSTHGPSRFSRAFALRFVIPVVESLLRRNVLGNTASNGPSCLVLTPTRELAMQVEAEFKKVIGPLRLKSVSVYGGVPYARQVDALCVVTIVVRVE